MQMRQTSLLEGKQLFEGHAWQPLVLLTVQLAAGIDLGHVRH